MMDLLETASCGVSTSKKNPHLHTVNSGFFCSISLLDTVSSRSKLRPQTMSCGVHGGLGGGAPENDPISRHRREMEGISKGLRPLNPMNTRDVSTRKSMLSGGSRPLNPMNKRDVSTRKSMGSGGSGPLNPMNTWDVSIYKSMGSGGGAPENTPISRQRREMEGLSKGLCLLNPMNEGRT